MPLRLDTRAASAGADAALIAPAVSVRLDALGRGNPLSVPPDSLDGAHVLVRTRDQLTAALALIALDAIAARLVIAPPDLKDDQLPGVIERAGIDTLVTDGEAIAGLAHVVVSSDALTGVLQTQALPSAMPAPQRPTQWIMFTSGTTGVPKMVAHSLAGLTDAIQVRAATGEKIVWGTFYDIRRYGGLQILLRALLGGASLVLSEAGEPVADFLARLGAAGVTHLTGTPSHWRRALMSPSIGRIAPGYVRLSGEIADQVVLDSLRTRFPGAALGHAYASTEAGVGFEVTDGREGFPASFVGGPGPVEMRVSDGALWVRSPRAAEGYVGHDGTLKTDGFVDTGDMVELRDGRYYFAGRRGGIINVGGLKIHPEEVETVINRHPAVRLSRVSGRKSPITGAIVVAEVVLERAGANANDNGLRDEILSLCRSRLAAFKVPAMVRFVPALGLTAGGKLARPHG